MKAMNRLLILMAGIALTSCATRALGQAPKSPVPHSNFWDERMALFATEDPIDSTDIVFLGDSQTQGGEWDKLFGMDNVINRGIIGDVIPGFLERVDPIVNAHPKKIFILGGANDVSHSLSADSVAREMIELVTYVKSHSPQSKIYVQTMLPINNSFGRYKNMIGKEQVIRDYNALLPAIAAEMGFTLINSYDHFVDAEGNLPAKFTTDGLHVNADGYNHWRELLLPYVLE